jgi:ketosteroid isomerase-like protein
VSRENVEIVREINALAGAPRIDDQSRQRLFELFSPEVHIDVSRRVFNPATYDGYDGLRRFRDDAREVWDELSFTTERVIEQGDLVIEVVTLRGRGRGSGVEVKATAARVWTIRGGRVVRLVGYEEVDEALRAVGLKE